MIVKIFHLMVFMVFVQVIFVHGVCVVHYEKLNLFGLCHFGAKMLGECRSGCLRSAIRFSQVPWLQGGASGPWAP